MPAARAMSAKRRPSSPRWAMRRYAARTMSPRRSTRRAETPAGGPPVEPAYHASFNWTVDTGREIGYSGLNHPVERRRIKHMSLRVLIAGGGLGGLTLA